MNESLLLKWWWRFGMDKEALWRKVIVSKSKLGQGSWSPEPQINNKMSILWKDIILIHERKPHIFQKYKENVKFCVGNGSKIIFWKDNWINDACLAVLYPSIYRLISNKDETLFEVLTRKAEHKQLDFQFRRRLYHWEEETLNALYEMLDRRGSITNEDREDHLVWSANNSKRYFALST